MSPTAAPEAPTTDRPSLAELAQFDPEQLLAPLHRALPDAEPGQVAVAAFQSSI